MLVGFGGFTLRSYPPYGFVYFLNFDERDYASLLRSLQMTDGFRQQNVTII
ncbi:hypothetical protein QUF74_17920 [Candidatus Halobeggiatoa sp. HSG11]|nr:hypothetical protein [Candidatus Halobeggiatoa sp. HSG11]